MSTETIKCNISCANAKLKVRKDINGEIIDIIDVIDMGDIDEVEEK